MAWIKMAGAGLAVVGAGGCYTLTHPELTRRSFTESPAFTNTKPDATSRTHNMHAMQAQYGSPDTPLDILVMGGGSTGSGVALDAATRGLKVALVEKEDFACGASSKSTKLLHGGVRYLEKAVYQLDPAQMFLVKEALKERSVVLHQAPHLCAPIGTVLPCYAITDFPLYWVGLKFYDVLAAMGGGTLSFNSSGMGPVEAKEMLPSLATVRKDDGKHLKGAVVYYDGQMNDARLNVSVAMTAARYGALVSNYLAAVHVQPKTTSTPVVAVTLQDQADPSAKPFVVYTKCLVNSTGPWTDRTRTYIAHNNQSTAGEEASTGKKAATPDELLESQNKHLEHKVKKSRGVHVTLPKEYVKDKGMIIPSTKDGRVIFMLPWEGVAIAGTTDTGLKNTYGEVPSDQQPTKKEVDFILESLTEYCDVNVKEGDVKSVWCGLRPLAMPPGAEGGSSQNVVREHVVSCDSESGIVTIAGGKWTTYRKMAEDVVDAALKGIPSLSDSVRKNTPRCVTDNVVLVGGDVQKGTRGFDDAALVSQVAHELASAPHLVNNQALAAGDEVIARHLLTQYGTKAEELAKNSDLASRSKVPLHPDFLLTEGEVRYLARYEQASRAADVLSRRTRIAFQDVQAAKTLVPKVIDILASEHHWSTKQKNDQTNLAFKHLESFDISAIPVDLQQ